MTKNARYILEIINSSDEHLTAEQIYLFLKEKNKKAVIATVYNNLSFLYKEGLIRKVSVEGYSDRYDKMIQHDHLVCRRCGKLTDIALEDLTEKLQKQLGISMLSYDLKINYICDDCLEMEKNREEDKKVENQKNCSI